MRVSSALVAMLLLANIAAAEERFAVVISGASGGEAHAVQHRKWRQDLTGALTAALRFAEANIVVLAEDDDGSARSTAESVRQVFDDLRRRLTRNDLLFIVLIGHGTFDGGDAKFNLVGPDLTAAEWDGLLAALPARTVIVNTTASSFPFLEQLSRRGRIVMTATDSAAQRFATVFPEYLVKVLGDASTDLDKNGRVSVWETFQAASAAVRRHYEQRGQLSTERPLLDDDGDRAGREAEAPAGGDGALARAVYLDSPPDRTSLDETVADLERQRGAVELQIEELKARKDTMNGDEYAAQLEKLLLQLSRIAQQIRQRS